MENLDIQSANVTVFVSVAIAVMFLLIISFLLAFNTSQRKKFQYHQNLLKLKEEQQKELIRMAVVSEETERHRIAEQLHDEVGALLSASKLYLGSFYLKKDPGGDKEVYNKSMELLDLSIKKIRAISHSRHSVILKDGGLNDSIKDFVQKLNQPGKFEITTELEAHHFGNVENDINIYRVTQELCGNIIKYSNASKVKIASYSNGDMLIFKLYHNGNGLTQNDFETLRNETKGLGLKNIQNRITLLNGKIDFEKNGNDNTITISVPANKL